MSKIKLEHIDNLRRGKKSGAKIGSRGTPHHLYKYEEVQYERALKNRYLEVTTKDRDNLINLREKVCMAQGWTNYLLIKIHGEDNASVLRKNAEIKKGEIKEMKILDRGQYKEAKLCVVCKKPFTIRKKWKNNFGEVLYCSERCRKAKKPY